MSTVTETPQEKARMDDLLMHMLPTGFSTALDVGTRFGHLSKRLADHFDCITALDLELPDIQHDKIVNAQGNVTCLKYPNDNFDVVYCEEVLEHLPQDILTQACAELSRVARHHLIIGVPYRQDIRFGQTTCFTCGKKNPPWGHINSFDENKLIKLFPDLRLEKATYIGESKDVTNFVSTLLMDLAGNPYGTYSQDEPCLHCGARLKSPPERNIFKKIFTRLALILRKSQLYFVKPFPRWIHVMLTKNEIIR